MDQHPIIKILLFKGIPIGLRLVKIEEKSVVVVTVDGFYKSGQIWLEPKDFDGKQGFIAHCRYSEKEEIRVVEDLVALNYSWWMRSWSRDPKSQPDGRWLPLLKDYGYLNEKVTTTYLPVDA